MSTLRYESYQAKKSKRWRAVFYHEGRRYRTRWADLKGDAETLGKDLITEVEAPPKKEVTVSVLIERYMAVRKLRPTTRQRYQYDADRIASDDIGGRKAAEVLPAEWDEYFASLPLKPKGVANCRALAHAAYRWGARGGLLTYNALADTEAPKVERAEVEAPTIASVQSAVSVLEGNRLEGAAVLCAAGGLRVGEAVARRWCDLDEHGVDVQAQYTQTRDMTKPKGQRLVLHLGDPKSKPGKRYVPLPAPALEHLVSLKLRQREKVMLEGRVWDDERLISSRRDGSPVPPNQASSELGRLWRRAGLAEMHPHLLRHAFITELIVRQGVDPQTASKMAGHSEAATTVRHYTHTDEAAKSAAADLLSQAWKDAYEKLVDTRQPQKSPESGAVADIGSARSKRKSR